MSDVYEWHSVEELIDRVADQKVYRDKFLDVMEIIATVTARQIADPVAAKPPPMVEVLEVRACKDCQWWEPRQYQEYCQCKALPPTAIAQPGYAPYAIFPRTKADDWCRAFHRREDGEDVRTVAKPADS